MESKRIKFEVGKSYHIKYPNSGRKVRKVHIDGVIKNTAYSPDESWLDNAEDLIVFRTWIVHRKRWDWKVSAYWELCMYNDWSYEK